MNAQIEIVSQGLDSKHQRLAELLRDMGSVVVAFSAGVDSTLVLKVALDALGRERVIAATGLSPSLARRELESVGILAKTLGARSELIETAELDIENYAANPTNRCYYCKTELYSRLSELAKSRSFSTIVNGINVDDLGDFRPGVTAASEWGIRAPLVEAGMGKAEVRELAKNLGLPNWDKPALACLSSRVPYGTPVTIGVLGQIERAEAFLYARGLSNFRVRHHQKVARIEVGLNDLPRLVTDPLRSETVSAFKELGYTYVTIDLAGFRSGSGNEVLAETTQKRTKEQA
jgi:uncharacterized protein